MIDKYIDRDKYEYEIKHTQRPHHATELAKSASNTGVDIVCAIGGDGTVNECAKALVHTDTAFAIIPGGSGNGLARHLHIPTDPIKAIELINEGNECYIDYGMAKAALNMATMNLINTFKDDKSINIFCVHPGWIRTDGKPDNPAPLSSYEAAEILRLLFEKKRNDFDGHRFITNLDEDYPF